ncbi:uncharacterized protein LOC136029146 isoform X1 [Artemia franciscana]|uniref:uncharacterized protein LOC136029146 isoform X1 n=1 Tax=Artemia franciscana TaxID=6661 RepID=UPI0032DB79EB
MANSSQTPYVEIIEQPSPKALRFRYECEGRMAGSLPGASSTADNKTYPAIKVHNYKGEAVVVVSCVTKDKPYRPHPHSLVGKEGCSKGVCTIRFSNDNMICTFPNLGIQCIKKKGIDEALRVRESLRVDPFNTGFSHRSKDIDLNVVRLCFQVFIEGNTPRKFNRPLEAIVSEPIYDKKAMCDLLISDLSQYAGPCSGGQRVFLLCEKIVKDDIQVKFYDDEGWEALAEFQHADVWKQVAIKFKTPPYKYHDRNGTVHIQLVRPSDGAVSESRQFHYYSVPGTYFDPSFMDDPCYDGNESEYSESESSLDCSEAGSVLNMNQFSNPLYESVQPKRVDIAIQCLLLNDKSNEIGSGDNHTLQNWKVFGLNSNGHDSQRISVASSFVGDQRESYLSEDLNEVLSMAGSYHSEMNGSICGSTMTLNNRLSLAGRSDATFDDRPLSVISITSECHPQIDDFNRSTISLNQRLSLAGQSVVTFSDVNSQRSSLASERSDLHLKHSDSMGSLNNRLSNIDSARDSFLSDFLESQRNSLSSESSLHDRLKLIDAADSSEGSDMLEKHLAHLESIKLEDFDDARTYSSYQMAMKDPMMVDSDEGDIYDNPFDGVPPLPPKSFKDIPVAPPRTTSVTEKTPPLPPRKFKKINQPLPRPPPDAFRSALMKAQDALKKALQGKGMGSKSVSKASISSRKLGGIRVSDEPTPTIEHKTVSDIILAYEPIGDKSENKQPGAIQGGPTISPNGLFSYQEIYLDSILDKASTSKIESDAIYGLVEIIKNKNPEFPSDLFDDLNDLTEAENYALYTTLAPLATMSEFDESETMSMLYQELMAVRNQALRQVNESEELSF